MADPVGNNPRLLRQRGSAGDDSVVSALFNGCRERLRRVVRLRLDRRAYSSDVLQKEIQSSIPGLKDELETGGRAADGQRPVIAPGWRVAPVCTGGWT